MTDNDMKPAFDSRNIPVFLGCDDAYAPYAGVVVKSLISNSSADHNYDIWILEGQISPLNKSRMLGLALGRPNVSVRFAEADTLLEASAGGELYTHDYLSQAMYYRLLAASLFKNYDRMIYLDSDLAVLADVAELYRDGTEDENKILACCREPYFSQVILHDQAYARFVARELTMLDHTTYFNSGVLALNLELIRAQNLERAFLAQLQQLEKPKNPDQDVLNMVCHGRVSWLDQAWNCYSHFEEHMDPASPFLSIKNAFADRPDLYAAFVAARARPKIVHYTSIRKPWLRLNVGFDRQFWRYAKSSPWAEELLDGLVESQYPKAQGATAGARLMSWRKNLARRKLRYSMLASLTCGKWRARYLGKAREMARDMELLAYLAEEAKEPA